MGNCCNLSFSGRASVSLNIHPLSSYLHWSMMEYRLSFVYCDTVCSISKGCIVGPEARPASKVESRACDISRELPFPRLGTVLALFAAANAFCANVETLSFSGPSDSMPCSTARASCAKCEDARSCLPYRRKITGMGINAKDINPKRETASVGRKWLVKPGLLQVGYYQLTSPVNVKFNCKVFRE